MRNQSGITLVALIVTVIILIIIATITVYNSIDMNKSMEYENYIAQLEELQSAVDKICEKYKTGGFVSYSDAENGYFIKKCNKIPGTLAIAENKYKAEIIIDEYFQGNSDFHEGFVFYFAANEIEDFFNINGISFDVIVDFSTRYVYSVEGMEAPFKNGDKIYSLIDFKSTNILQKDEALAESSATGITFTQKYLQSGETEMYEITLVLNYGIEGSKYNIKKAYYSNNNGEKWLEVDYLGDCKYTENTVTFYIYNPGTYLFKIEDTSGDIISNVQGADDSVYTTINF